MIWCFNEHKDVPRDIRDFLENASGEPLEKLSIKDINSLIIYKILDKRIVKA